MQTTNFRHCLSLSRSKTFLIALFLTLAALPTLEGQAQTRKYWFEDDIRGHRYNANIGPSLRRNKKRLSRPLNFGFYIAPMQSRFVMKYDPAFGTDPTLNDVVAIIPKKSIGFGLGFYSNIRLNEFFDVRINAGAAFYERTLEAQFADGTTETETVESSMVEVPIMLKYRSQIRGIHGMYLLAGLKPSMSLGRKTKEDGINITTSDISVEYGIGSDVFFPFFKFAPELRFSHGLLNVLDTQGESNGVIQRLSTHTVSLYFNFGG